MSLMIDTLQLTLPASLANRKLVISKLLSSELKRFDWPQDTNINHLQTPVLSISAQQSNLLVARAIARQIHSSTLQYVQQGGAQ